ncbi:MAG TPA: PQQ-binding-like beta-propeller repeat protein [Planctomycetaceae bacterium]|nr:PQQ-binding-like beta-propeller repeat protein [Planctomycetaceae bacterium]
MKVWLSLCVGLALAAGTVAAGDWPQWRGADRKDIQTETGLMQSWPEGGPQRVWLNTDVGLGYSGVAVVGDTLYTMGARGEDEFLIAVNVADGTERWATKMGGRLGNDWGDGPRGTPAVDGDRVYGLSGIGVLACLQTADGKLLWEKSLSDFGGRRPNWGYCESVTIDGQQVLCTPGGKQGAVLALDKVTGSTLWQSQNFTDGAHYSSIVPIDFAGKHQLIQLTKDTLVGLDAATGDVLWKTGWPGQTAVIPTPIFKDGYVYITSGYGVGCKLVKLESDLQATEVYFNKEMKNHHGGVILIGDHVYGHSDPAGWMCQDFLSGEKVWVEREVLGKGSVTCADGRLYCLDERDGTVKLVEPSPEGWKEHGQFKLSPQTEQRSPSGRIWTHPVVANGKLYLRDQEILLCYDVKAP